MRRNIAPGRGVRRIDLSPIRAALKDRRCWACLGLVTAGEDGNHFEQTADDVLVEVSIMPTQERITARLSGMGAGAKGGLWAIPSVGTEVAVLVPDGEFDFSPLIVGTLSTGAVPSALSENKILMSHTAEAVVDAPAVKLGAVASEAVIKGNAYSSAESTFVSALVTVLTAMAPRTVPTSVPEVVTFASAATTFLTSTTAALSTKTTTE